MRLNIEHGLVALRPSKGKSARLSDFLATRLCLTISDSRTVNNWRGENLSALAATQEVVEI